MGRKRLEIQREIKKKKEIERDAKGEKGEIGKQKEREREWEGDRERKRGKEKEREISERIKGTKGKKVFFVLKINKTLQQNYSQPLPFVSNCLALRYLESQIMVKTCLR